MPRRCIVAARFFPPPAPLARYFTTFYCADITVADGIAVTDHLHPEWSNLRFHAPPLIDAENHAGMRIGATHFSATGPSAHALRFTVGSGRIWGAGLLPLGWAKFVGVPAAELANAVVDGARHAAFASFLPLADSLFEAAPDSDAELARITTHFLARVDAPVAGEARIVAVHRAIVDPETATAAQLAEVAALTSRTLERVCNRAFGFAPKLLLRRQRFMRSLAQFMLDPSLKWIGALDGHYHDQAQFVREFRQFMGMTPGEYAARPHPILDAFVAARARLAGAAVQTLDQPGGAALLSSPLIPAPIRPPISPPIPPIAMRRIDP